MEPRTAIAGARGQSGRFRAKGADKPSLYDEVTDHDEVTDRIIAELEEGRAPWVQPWGTFEAKAGLGLPVNALTAAPIPASTF